jgi:hypothetical protein
MPRNNPCHTCAGGIDCEECINDPRNSTPVKLYTPKGAARAMLVGKILKGDVGLTYSWDNGSNTFKCKHREGKQSYPVCSFSGLWEEER